MVDFDLGFFILFARFFGLCLLGLLFEGRLVIKWDIDCSALCIFDTAQLLLILNGLLFYGLFGVGAVLGGLYAGGKAMTCGGVFGGLLAFGMGWGWVLAAVLDCCLDLVCPLRAVFLVVVFLFLVCAITKLSLPLSEYHGKNYR